MLKVENLCASVGDKQILKGINLEVKAGEVHAIMGPNGSGKSTLINLLLRYYDHYEGTITIGGVDIRDIDMHYYRERIGYVQQEPMMFHDTIYNNICYGNGAIFYTEGNEAGAGRRCMRLNFGGQTEASITENFKRLGEFFTEKLEEQR